MRKDKNNLYVFHLQGKTFTHRYLLNLWLKKKVLDNSEIM